MGLFDNFPYTNFHELNLMWILEALKEIQTTTEQFVAINSLKYADPIQWNIVKQYEKNTIVIDPLTGTAYISVQPVPTGVILTNTDYWTVVFDLGSFVTRAAKNFTDHYEADTTLNATFNSNEGDWLVWGDILYKAITNINIGDMYVVDTNIQHFTMENWYNSLTDFISIFIGKNANNFTSHVETGDTATIATSQGNWLIIDNVLYRTTANISIGDQYVEGVNIQHFTLENFDYSIRDIINDIIDNIGDLDNLTTSVTTTIVDAINSLLSDITNTIGDLNDLNTRDKSSVVNSINSLNSEANLLEKFRNKTIAVLGDSISAYSTLPNNWVRYIADKLQPYGTTVINQAIDGDSFAGLADKITNNLFTVADADYYILFLGTNYSDSWGFSTGVDPLLPALSTVTNAIRNANPNAKWFFVSPLKKYLSGTATLLNPLCMVRSYLEKYFAENGFTVISGYNIGELNATNIALYMTDTIHPTEAFSPILGEYILNGLVNERSNITVGASAYRSFINTITASSLVGYYYDDTLTLKAKISVNSWTPTTDTWIDLADMPTMYDSVPTPLRYLGMNYQGNYLYSIRNSGNKLQIYFFGSPDPGTITSFNECVEFKFPHNIPD